MPTHDIVPTLRGHRIRRWVDSEKCSEEDGKDDWRQRFKCMGSG